MKILWFSAGVTSAVACKMALEKYKRVRIIYIHIDSAHKDNKRFIKDCEKWYGQSIEVHKSNSYTDQFDVIKKTKYVNGAKGARCTLELKKAVRAAIEKTSVHSGQIFGFEYSKKEINRANRFINNNPHINVKTPLIKAKLTKKDCLQILVNANIEPPMMYKLGYPNNNCVGCVKGGMGYWNKIRIDFPSVFKKMSLVEREVGRSCLKEADGSRLFLDTLDPKRGNSMPILIEPCSATCEEQK